MRARGSILGGLWEHFGPTLHPQLAKSLGQLWANCPDHAPTVAQSWPGQMRTVYGDHLRYIDTYFSDSYVIILGDFNDEIIDTENIFDIFLDDNENYEFTDMPIAQSPSEYWSYPSFPSHIDHIVITNELFNNHISTSTILIENALPNLSDYNNYISDHRPVGIKLSLEP